MAILSETEKTILRAMADCNMHVTRAAERCNYSRQTVYDRLLKIEAKTGINPNDFRGLVKLLTKIGYFEN